MAKLQAKGDYPHSRPFCDRGLSYQSRLWGSKVFTRVTKSRCSVGAVHESGIASIQSLLVHEEGLLENRSTVVSGIMTSGRRGAPSTMVEPVPYLPDELMFKIIARLPYPDIFRIRCLSKRWRSLLCDDSGKADKKAFQDELRPSTSAWFSYFLLQIRAGCLYGYDMKAQKWEKLPMHSGSQYDIPRLTIVMCSGSMLCYASRNINGHYPLSFSLTVANIFTGRFKRLNTPVVSSLPGENFIPVVTWSSKILFHASSEGYTIGIVRDIQCCKTDRGCLVLQVYDSRRESWITDFIQIEDWIWAGIRIATYSILVESSKIVILASIANLDDSLPIRPNSVIITYDVRTKRSDEIRFKFPDISVEKVCLVLCGSRLIVMTWRSDEWGGCGDVEQLYNICIHEVQENTGEVVLLNDELRGVEVLGEHTVSSDEDRVYTSWTTSESECDIYVYHLTENSWTRRSDAFAVQPRTCSDEPVNGGCRLVLMPGPFTPGPNPLFDPSSTAGNSLTRWTGPNPTVEKLAEYGI